VRTPTNLFETAGTVEVFVPKEIIDRRIQDIFAGPNKDRKTDQTEKLKILPDFNTIPTPFFPSVCQGHTQEMPKLLSGQEKLATDVAVVEWIIDTIRSLTVSQNPKFLKMMQVSPQTVHLTTNHHRHRKLTKQGWKCITGSRYL